MHDETNILPIQKHLQLHPSHVRQEAQYPSHPLQRTTTSDVPQASPETPALATTADMKANMRDKQTRIVSQHLAARDNIKILPTHLCARL